MESKFSEGFELAVSVDAQQQAALYGVGAGLLSIGSVPNKKQIKRVVKLLRAKVAQSIGDPQGTKEVLAQNSGAISMAIAGIRKDPSIDDVARKKVLATVKEDLLNTFKKGAAFQGFSLEG
jgi:hypothetical protein